MGVRKSELLNRLSHLDSYANGTTVIRTDLPHGVGELVELRGADAMRLLMAQEAERTFLRLFSGLPEILDSSHRSVVLDQISFFHKIAMQTAGLLSPGTRIVAQLYACRDLARRVVIAESLFGPEL